MMSYQDCQPLYKYHEEELIALFVETLTGTTFEMTVSPYDTIMSIKNKIQRVEGIPVSQQHLLYNLHELEDSAALMDYSITNGSTIKLVLSMRGGPISTVRRILPLDDMTWRELVDFNRDDLLDDLPAGCRMAVLVFREGDQLNMLRVLENMDGTYSPLSDSWSGSSMRNLFEEDDSDDCSKQRLEENSVTMEKMNHLKNKLEQLAIQRKNHKLGNKDCDDFRSVPNMSSPEGNKESSRLKNRSVSSSKRKNFLQLPPLAADEKECSNESISPERLRKTRTTEFSRVPVLPDITPSPPSIAIFDSDVEPVAVPRPKTSPDRLTGHQICEILSEAGRHRLLGAHHCSTSPLHSIPPVPNDDNNFNSEWYNSGRLNSNKSLDKPSTSASLYRSNNTLSDKKMNRTVVSPFNIFQSRNSGGANSVSSLFSSTKVGKLPIHNGSIRRNVATPHTIAGKSKLPLTSIQSVGKTIEVNPIDIRPKFLGLSVGNSNKHLPSLASEMSKPLSNVTYTCTLSHSQSEQYMKKSSQNANKTTEDAGANDSEYPSSVPGTSSSLNMTKPGAKKNKKEHRNRCAKCNKRLTVTNTYTCRCSRIFCTYHRYSEAHECSYDYKSEGRKILEQNNPLISAPKLPKI